MNKKKIKARKGGWGWRYGVVRKTARNKLTKKIEHYYEVHEIYGSGAWTKNPITPCGESLDDLRWSLSMMLGDSFRGSIYEERNGKLVKRVE